MKFYTGIGSRATPPEMLALMTKIAEKLQSQEYILRSGGAEGADLAFEAGAGTQKEIYLPWRGFNNSDSKLFNVSQAAMDIAAPHHPGWVHLKESVRKLMGRNAYQALGESLDSKTSFVVCWTPDGAQTGRERTHRTGGTGLAISLASSLGIPVFNLAKEDVLIRMKKFVGEE